jgi:hypothetical protein
MLVVQMACFAIVFCLHSAVARYGKILMCSFYLILGIELKKKPFVVCGRALNILLPVVFQFQQAIV